MGKALFTVYDIETTGLSAACQNEIIEFAGFQLDKELNCVGSMHKYIKPYKKIPKKITEITGITDTMVADAGNRFQVLPQIRNFIGDTISVCHNAQFDFTFISTMCIQQNLKPLNQYICTLKSYKAITGEKSGTLSNACEHYGIVLENAHSAIADAEATMKLFCQLFNDSPLFEEGSKLFYKAFDDKEIFQVALKTIASQNPNKKVREALQSSTSSDEPIKQVDAHRLFDMFENKREPVSICSETGWGFKTVSDLFMLWLNPSRLPRFIYLEDITLNRQVKQMISFCGSIDEVYMMHREIYKDSQSINYGLYNYFWLKFGKSHDKDTVASALTTLFEKEVSLKDICDWLPHISIIDILTIFCQFATQRKNDHHSYIANNICGRRELIETLDNGCPEPSREQEASCRRYIAYTLAKNNFFKCILSNSS